MHNQCRIQLHSGGDHAKGYALSVPDPEDTPEYSPSLETSPASDPLATHLGAPADLDSSDNQISRESGQRAEADPTEAVPEPISAANEEPKQPETQKWLHHQGRSSRKDCETQVTDFPRLASHTSGLQPSCISRFDHSADRLEIDLGKEI